MNMSVVRQRMVLYFVAIVSFGNDLINGFSLIV